MVLMSRLRRLTSRCVAKSASADLKKHFARHNRAPGQAHPQRISQPNVFGVSFGNGGANPGITEVHDSHNRLAGIDHFPFAGGRAPKPFHSPAQGFSYSQGEPVACMRCASAFDN